MMCYARTKQHILEFLKHKTSSGTPVDISEAMSGMKADGKAAVNEYGHYSLHEELQA